MPEIPIDLRSSHRVEADGSHTVVLVISGLPNIDQAQRVNLWLRGLIQQNAHQIGRREPNAKQH